MLSPLATVLLAGTFAGPPSGATAPSEAPPGGYWTMSEQREREGKPRDGEEELTVGSVLFSLGLLRIGAALLSVWMADRPSLCANGEPDCGASLRTFGWVGLGEGGLLTGTGIVYLAIGASRRSQYQRWERGESLSARRPLGQRVQLGPWLLGPREPAALRAVSAPVRPGLTGGGFVLQLRF